MVYRLCRNPYLPSGRRAMSIYPIRVCAAKEQDLLTEVVFTASHPINMDLLTEGISLPNYNCHALGAG